MDNRSKALQQVHNLLDLQAKDNAAFKVLATHLQHLINNNFNDLLSILYRIDVSEVKIKKALAQKMENTSSGEIIAELLIERQIQKLRFKAQYNNKS